MRRCAVGDARSQGLLENLSTLELKAAGCKVVRIVLAVVVTEAPFQKMCIKGGERDFRGVAPERELRFREEHVLDGDAVQAADELAILEDFNRVSMAGFMKSDIGFDDGRGNPSQIEAAGTRRGARFHCSPEGAVKPDVQPIPFH